MNPRRSKAVLLIFAVMLLAVLLPVLYVKLLVGDGEDLFFGVSFGLETASEAKLLIDKVKGYTNLFVVNSWDISTNETALNEVCEYAVNSGMHLIVFFDFISHQIYPWHCSWLEAAKEKWGDKFLGVYLYDEPGGRQIDRTEMRVFEASNYSDAANKFVGEILLSLSMSDLKIREIRAFTSDYALYWFDYLAGYDCVFVEFGWNHSITQHIALGRGAAKVQGKDWGVIITWTYNHPPYMESGEELLKDMVTAYKAGAKYIIVFNYPKINQYGILEEEHFAAMRKFWFLVHRYPRSLYGQIKAQAAFILPKDYGWGMRNVNDGIWGLWGSDELSQQIWEKMNTLIEEHGLELDIIYDDPQFNFKGKYSKLYYWNSTTN